jgi:pyruvate/2-oxoacid:ferredoxin oxidoreductase beta subunit
MLLASTGYIYGEDSMCIIAPTGCNTVYGSTYPYNPFKVPWVNSLFENAPAVALGVRIMWDKYGWKDKKVWVIGGDGAIADIGFQPLSRVLASGMDVNILVLDTQVYSNTGGQASTTTFMGQNASLSSHGKEIGGKIERRKELAQICMMHPDTFVAQVSAGYPLHFYKAVKLANEYPGPSLIIAYCPCMPEHGIGDDTAFDQSRLAVQSRAHPLVIYDPRKGERIKDRLSLEGNPAIKDDWYKDPKTGEVIDFIYFARTEGRFAKHFDKEGNPSDILIRSQEDRLFNWRQLQELAGLR